jgi:DNA-binding NtrC family response regulator
MIYGERGSGREFVAEVLHQTGYRRSEPFEKMTCSGWGEPFLEAELLRRLELAEGGTLFLDDVNELPPRLLVRALAGGTRIIASCDPGAEVRENINEFAIRITVPPLRQR